MTGTILRGPLKGESKWRNEIVGMRSIAKLLGWSVFFLKWWIHPLMFVMSIGRGYG